jgi:hypothetical protein
METNIRDQPNPACFSDQAYSLGYTVQRTSCVTIESSDSLSLVEAQRR